MTKRDNYAGPWPLLFTIAWAVVAVGLFWLVVGR